MVARTNQYGLTRTIVLTRTPPNRRLPTPPLEPSSTARDDESTPLVESVDHLSQGVTVGVTLAAD